MKNQAAIILFLFWGGLQLPGQTLTDTLVDELCQCVMEEVTSEASAETIKMELGLCMITMTTGRTEEIQAEMGIDLNSPGGFREFGEKIGGILALKCEKFVELLFQAKEGESSLADEAIADKKEVSRSSHQVFDGKVTKLKGREILILKVKGAEGEVEFYCLEEFEGANVLKFGAELIGKEVKIEYNISNLYNPDTFEFEERKVINSIRLKK